MAQTYTIEQALAIATQQHLAGDLPQAEAIYRQILQVAPTHPDALHNLGELAYRVKRLDVATDLVTRAIAARPNDALFHNTLAAIHFAAGRPDDSYDECRRAIALNPNLSHPYGNLGNCLADRGDIAGSIAAFEKALALDPNNATAHDGLGLSLLMAGDLQRGWRQQEWRWKKPGFEPQRFAGQPHWQGGDLRGKRLLIYVEQGYGDVFQFCRYIPLLAARGATVLLETVPEIQTLMAGLPGVAEVFIGGRNPPACDLVCSLMSLPLWYGTTLETVPAQVPYLSADAALVAQWAEFFRPTGGLKVGIAWAGRPTHSNDHHRSTTFETFAALADVAGVTFYSLQKGPAAAQAAPAPAGMNLVALGDRLPDFSTTAAVVANLDLVIAVDTAIVHLAGALARPVWTLLPFCPDWRWMLQRDDSPWYPTMRLFRGTRRNDWPGIMGRVKTALHDWAAR